jgi:hypothetical protein
MEVQMKEYRVTRDVSLKNDNNPVALEKIANEMAGDGWRLITSVMSDAGTTSKIFLFWERERS